MAFLFSISFIFCTVLVSSLSYCLSIENSQGAKIVGPSFANFCSYHGHARNSKITCIICKGFDPSCFIPSTTTTSTTTTTTTTTTPSTTTTTSSTTTPTTTTIPAE